MKVRSTLCMVFIIGLMLITSAYAQSFVPGKNAEDRLARSNQVGQQITAKQSSVFIRNDGQWDNKARFLMKGDGVNFWVTNTGIVYDMFQFTNPQSADGIAKKFAAGKIDASLEGHVVKMNFLGASSQAKAVGYFKQPGVHNYFIGCDRSKYASNVPLFAQTSIENLYAGVSVKVYSESNKPRYDIVLAPNADATKVRLGFEGADGVSVTKEGDLAIATSVGTIRQVGLFAYQNVNGNNKKVECRFVKNANGEITFALGNYDKTKELVIDPLWYSQMLGNAGGNTVTPYGDIETDAAGNVYIAGGTNDPTFPATSGGYNNVPPRATQGAAGGYDAFVAKFGPNGNSLVYATYIGGNGQDVAFGLAVNPSGEVYICGGTSSTTVVPPTPAPSAAFNFPTAPALPTALAPYRPTNNPSVGAPVINATSTGFGVATNPGPSQSTDVFVVKLNAAGSTPLYSSVIGGRGELNALGGGTLPCTDIAYDIAIDPANPNVVAFTGETYFDVVIPTLTASLNPAVTAAHTNGAGGDAARRAAFSTPAPTLTDMPIAYPTTANAYMPGPNIVWSSPVGANTRYVSHDAFMSKLDLNGGANGLVYSTFIGTTNNVGFIPPPATGGAITTLFGSFGSSNPLLPGIPSAPNPFFATNPGNVGLYVFFVPEIGYGIHFGANGVVTVGGMVGNANTTVATMANAAGATGNGDIASGANLGLGADPVITAPATAEGFYIKLNTNAVLGGAAGGSLLNWSYIGGSADDIVYDIAMDGANNLYLTGYTNSAAGTWGGPGSWATPPCVPGSTAAIGSAVLHGPSDAFVVKLNTTIAGVGAVAPNVGYYTFIGGATNETGYGIRVDAANQAHITGVTSSADFPRTAPDDYITAATFMDVIRHTTGLRGATDAFATKLEPKGCICYSTLISGVAGGALPAAVGAPVPETGYGVALDMNGNMVMLGNTSGAGASLHYNTPANVVPVPNLAATQRGANEAFITKLYPADIQLASIRANATITAPATGLGPIPAGDNPQPIVEATQNASLIDSRYCVDQYMRITWQASGCLKKFELELSSDCGVTWPTGLIITPTGGVDVTVPPTVATAMVVPGTTADFITVQTAIPAPAANDQFVGVRYNAYTYDWKVRDAVVPLGQSCLSNYKLRIRSGDNTYLATAPISLGDTLPNLLPVNNTFTICRKPVITSVSASSGRVCPTATSSLVPVVPAATPNCQTPLTTPPVASASVWDISTGPSSAATPGDPNPDNWCWTIIANSTNSSIPYVATPFNFQPCNVALGASGIGGATTVIGTVTVNSCNTTASAGAACAGVAAINMNTTYYLRMRLANGCYTTCSASLPVMILKTVNLTQPTVSPTPAVPPLLATTTAASTAPTLRVNNTTMEMPSICESTTLKMTVGACGTDSVFQWQKFDSTPGQMCWKNIAGAVTPDYMKPSVDTNDRGRYRVLVGGACHPAPAPAVPAPVGPACSAVVPVPGGCPASGATTMPLTAVGTCGYVANPLNRDALVSTEIAVTVLGKPRIIIPLVDLTRCVGEPVLFSVQAIGAANLTYEWSFSPNVGGPFIPITGAPSGDQYPIVSLTSANAGYYKVTVRSTICNLTEATSTMQLKVIQTPVETLSPVDKSVCVGQSATFTVTATGSTPILYQWQKDYVDIPGATSATLTLNNVQANMQGTYRCVYLNACSTVVNGKGAILTVKTAPTLVEGPISQTICATGSAIFKVNASGQNLQYQWKKDGTVIPGATNTSYAVFNATATDAGTYSVTVTGDCQPSLNASAVLTITPSPKITAQPVDISACEGENATFTITATGATGYQWRKNGVNIAPGGNSATLTLSAVTSNDVGSYDVVVSGACLPNETSVRARLTVNKPATITSDIRDVSVCVGDQINLTIGAIGNGLTYQWRKDGTAIPGATGASFSKVSATEADAGVYDVVVTAQGCKGTVASAKATVTVNASFSITASPSSQTVCVGGAVTLSVTTTGNGVSYQWRRNGVNLSGRTGDKLILDPVKLGDAGDYDCLVSGPCKSPVASGVATLKVDAPPTVSITSNGVSFCEGTGSTIKLSAVATGSGITYQWRRNGSPIQGATGANYEIIDPKTDHSGTYEVVVSNNCKPDAVSSSISISVNKVALTASTGSLNFGTVNVGEYKEDYLVFINSGNSSVNVTGISSPNTPFVIMETVPATFPVTLNKGEELRIKVRYIAKEGTQNGSIQVNIDRPCAAQLTGTLVGSGSDKLGKAALRILDMTSYVKNTSTVPMRIEYAGSPVNMQAAGITSVTFEVAFNRTLLYPSNGTPVRYEGGEAIMKITVNNPPLSGILTEIPMHILLGNARTTPLRFYSQPVWTGGTVKNTGLFDGLYTAYDFCDRGGIRGATNGGSITLLSPNPANTSLKVNFTTVSNTETEVKLYDMKGQEMISVVNQESVTAGNERTAILDVSKLASGTYMVVIRDGEAYMKQLVMVVK